MDETGQLSSAPMSRGQVSALINSVKRRYEVHEYDGGHDVGGSRPQDGRAILREEMDKWEEAWDDVTGAELEPQRVAQARQDEMEFFYKMNAYTRCSRACIVEEKGKLIDVRWIDTNKGDAANPNYRSRLVGREFNTYRDDALYAATPPLEALRLIISHAATIRCGGGHRGKLRG